MIRTDLMRTCRVSRRNRQKDNYWPWRSPLSSTNPTIATAMLLCTHPTAVHTRLSSLRWMFLAWRRNQSRIPSICSAAAASNKDKLSSRKDSSSAPARPRETCDPWFLRSSCRKLIRSQKSWHYFLFMEAPRTRSLPMIWLFRRCYPLPSTVEQLDCHEVAFFRGWGINKCIWNGHKRKNIFCTLLIDVLRKSCSLHVWY